MIDPSLIDFLLSMQGRKVSIKVNKENEKLFQETSPKGLLDFKLSKTEASYLYKKYYATTPWVPATSSWYKPLVAMTGSPNGLGVPFQTNLVVLRTWDILLYGNGEPTAAHHYITVSPYAWSKFHDSFTDVFGMMFSKSLPPIPFGPKNIMPESTFKSLSISKPLDVINAYSDFGSWFHDDDATGDVTDIGIYNNVNVDGLGGLVAYLKNRTVCFSSQITFDMIKSQSRLHRLIQELNGTKGPFTARVKSYIIKRGTTVDLGLVSKCLAWQATKLLPGESLVDLSINFPRLPGSIQSYELEDFQAGLPYSNLLNYLYFESMSIYGGGVDNIATKKQPIKGGWYTYDIPLVGPIDDDEMILDFQKFLLEVMK